jgi:glycerophosphoryl diester phosphodiesterase
MLIAHAGGAIHNQTYTNSLEALNSNYEKGFRFFEIDFSWTSDGELVAIHDWDVSFQDMFYLEEIFTIPTRDQFLALKGRTGLTQLSFENVLRWAHDKQDVFIVTDIKESNIEALIKATNDFSDSLLYFIPQVYSYEEYEQASVLGFKNIILTLYKMKINPNELIFFAKKENPFAITMHWEVARAGMAYYLNKIGIIVYAHTVNDHDKLIDLSAVGVFGIYTDFISPRQMSH